MAKLDKAPAYEAGDCRFESCSERQLRLGASGTNGDAANRETTGGKQQSNGEVAERLKALPC